MPNNSVQQGVGIINASEPTIRRDLPIFAAKYNDRAIALLKNSDFLATITSVRNAFPALSTTPNSQIRLFSHFEEFGELQVELTKDIWKEISPYLRVVEVSISSETFEEAANEAEAVIPVNDFPDTTAPGKILVHVIGGPVDLALSITETSSVLELKEMVYQLDPRLPKNLTFTHQDINLDEVSKQLREYNIIDQSIVSMTTNIQVHVTTSGRSKVSMRITLYAGVSSLKLVIYARLEIPVNAQIFVYAGEELEDVRQLGSYPQITHNCEVFAILDTLPFATPIRPHHIQVKPAWAMDDDDESDRYLVFPHSTVLDTKVLVFNVNMIAPSRQTLEFKGLLLQDDMPLSHYQVGPGDTLTMRINNQRA